MGLTTNMSNGVVGSAVFAGIALGLHSLPTAQAKSIYMSSAIPSQQVSPSIKELSEKPTKHSINRRQGEEPTSSETSDTPTSSVDPPTSSVDTPTSSVDTSTPTADTPTSSVDTPTPTADTPTSSVDTPSPTTSEMTPLPATDLQIECAENFGVSEEECNAFGVFISRHRGVTEAIFNALGVDSWDTISSDDLNSITTLSIVNQDISSLSELDFLDLSNLENLDLSQNQIKVFMLPSNLVNLIDLNLSNNQIVTFLAPNIPSSLRSINLGNNLLTSIPNEILSSDVSSLVIYGNQFTISTDTLRQLLSKSTKFQIGYRSTQSNDFSKVYFSDSSKVTVSLSSIRLFFSGQHENSVYFIQLGSPVIPQTEPLLTSDQKEFLFNFLQGNLHDLDDSDHFINYPWVSNFLKQACSDELMVSKSDCNKYGVFTDRTPQILTAILDDLQSTTWDDVTPNMLRNIQTVDASYSNLYSLRKDDFHGLDNVRNVILYANYIRSLPSELFNPTPNLQRLSMDGNRLVITPELFQKFRSLPNNFVFNYHFVEWEDRISFDLIDERILLADVAHFFELDFTRNKIGFYPSREMLPQSFQNVTLSEEKFLCIYLNDVLRKSNEVDHITLLDECDEIVPTTLPTEITTEGLPQVEKDDSSDDSGIVGISAFFATFSFIGLAASIALVAYCLHKNRKNSLYNIHLPSVIYQKFKDRNQVVPDKVQSPPSFNCLQMAQPNDEEHNTNTYRQTEAINPLTCQNLSQDSPISVRQTQAFQEPPLQSTPYESYSSLNSLNQSSPTQERPLQSTPYESYSSLNSLNQSSPIQELPTKSMPSQSHTSLNSLNQSSPTQELPPKSTPFQSQTSLNSLNQSSPTQELPIKSTPFQSQSSLNSLNQSSPAQELPTKSTPLQSQTSLNSSNQSLPTQGLPPKSTPFQSHTSLNSSNQSSPTQELLPKSTPFQSQTSLNSLNQSSPTQGLSPKSTPFQSHTSLNSMTHLSTNQALPPKSTPYQSYCSLTSTDHTSMPKKLISQTLRSASMTSLPSSMPTYNRSLNNRSDSARQSQTLASQSRTDNSQSSGSLTSTNVSAPTLQQTPYSSQTSVHSNHELQTTGISSLDQTYADIFSYIENTDFDSLLTTQLDENSDS